MKDNYTFLNRVFYHYNNLAKTAQLGLYALALVAGAAVTVCAVKVAIAL